MSRLRARPRRDAENKALFLGCFHRPDHHGFACRLCRQRADYVVTALVGGQPYVGRVCYAHAQMTGHALMHNDYRALARTLGA